MEWEVNKSNADGERRQLNRILDEIGTTMATTGNLVEGTNITLTGDLEGRLVGPGDITIAAAGGGGGTVTSVVPGTGIDVDATDPANPEVALDAATIASLALADTAIQPGDLGTAAYEDVGFFATAAQGALANSAVQPGDNISLLTNNSGYTTNTGTVTSVNLANSTGLTASGGPITTSGSLTYTLSANLQAWHGLATSAKLDSSAVSAYGLTLIDDANAAAARTTLGLGTAAVENIGTFITGVPLLSGVNTWAATQTFQDITATKAQISWISFPSVVGTPTGLIDGYFWRDITNGLSYRDSGVTQTVWHNGNQLAIGTTASTARTALGLGTAALSAATDFEPAIAPGTDAQFRRGDETWSSELMGSLMLTAPTGAASIVLTAYSNNTAPYQIRSQKARGTASVPLKAINGDVLAQLHGRGYQETTGAFTGNVGDFSLECTQDFTSTANGTRWVWSTVANGSTTRVDRLYLNDVSLNPATTGVLSLGTASLQWSATYTQQANLSGAEYDTGIESPASWAANVDNLAIAATTRVLRVSGTAARNLSGIVQTGSGRRLTLCNVGTFNVVLIHDLTSTAANRFLCPGSVNFTLTPNMAIELWYDSTSQRWRVIN